MFNISLHILNQL